MEGQNSFCSQCGSTAVDMVGKKCPHCANVIGMLEWKVVKFMLDYDKPVGINPHPMA